MKPQTIMLADMESFYASVEIARNPSLRGRPVVVCGDPERRHGIVLAASKEAKAFGIKAGGGAWECHRLCPNVVLVRPHMQQYIDVSLQITAIFQQFTDRVFPYSIDEQFLDMSGCEGLWGTPLQAARRIITQIREQTGIRCRIGIGENPLQAKMACDCFAKKNSDGIFTLNHGNYASQTWPLPVGELFGVGRRMERNLFNIGIRTIGQLAVLPREDLKWRWGINGEILWLNAHGIDYSNPAAAAQVREGVEDERRGVGHCMTLPRDYRKKEELEVVLLEITEEVCRRTRSLGQVGQVVGVYCRGADFDCPSGFSRQRKLPQASALTMEIYPLVRELFYAHWDYRPVRALGVGLSGLLSAGPMQLSLLEDRERSMALSRTMDDIRRRFGLTSLFRLSSLAPGGQLFTLSKQIGGHSA
ncbi:MAG: DNA polymerase IV [Bacillota bacterium]